jgi:nucleotide-binding universal stress UspA family protein
MKPFQRILVATDFSEASGPAWTRALTMAKESRAALVVVHAYEPPNVAQAEAVAPGVFDDWDRNVREMAGKKLDALVREAQSLGLYASRVVQPGDPDESIVKVAADCKADLIVMGTHGRRGFSRLLLGSVASYVVAMAPCAVLTVRSTGTPINEANLVAASA